MARSKKITHDKIKEITKPAHSFGLAAAVVTLAISLFLLVEMIRIGNFFYLGWISLLGLAIIVHIIISGLMLAATILLRIEHHNLGGSIMLLAVSIIGINLAAGIFIGPILGIIGGILGLKEHEKIVKGHI